MKYFITFLLGFIFSVALEIKILPFRYIGIPINTCLVGNKHQGMLSYKVRFNSKEEFTEVFSTPKDELGIRSYELLIDKLLHGYGEICHEN